MLAVLKYYFSLVFCYATNGHDVKMLKDETFR
jgi:hypothetical protein